MPAAAETLMESEIFTVHFCSISFGRARAASCRLRDRDIDSRSIGKPMAQRSGLMQGKRGVILGVANNRSIAWGIAKACHAAGAKIALTWQGDALKKRVEPLANELGGILLGHCDVTEPATIDAV